MESTRISLFYRSLIVLAGVLLAQLLMLAFQVRQQADIPLIRYGTVLVVNPVHRAMNAVSDAAWSAWNGYVNLRGAREQSAALASQVDQLRMENQRLEQDAVEVRRLRQLLDLKTLIPAESVAARVLSGSAGETSRLIMIDKGQDFGVRPDAPVMAPDGVVGKVLKVFPDSAQVILLSDPFSGAGVLLELNRVHGILKGRNDQLLNMDFVPNGERVALGQRVFTSGEDQIYPRGLPVGVVTETAPGPQFQQITVRPLASLQSLEEVLVIVKTDFELPLPPPAPPDAGPGVETKVAPAPSAVPSPTAPVGAITPPSIAPAGSAPAGVAPPGVAATASPPPPTITPAATPAQ